MKPIKMPYGLKSLWDKKSSITYSCTQSKLLRKSYSVEENAAFLVRWAAELYSGWATWMKFTIPGCLTCYKTSTLRIVNKINEMKDKNEIEDLNKGW